MSEELRSSLYAFDLVQKRAKKPAGAPESWLARPVTKVGVVGAGLMASQLALLFLRRLEVPVVISDLDAERVERGIGYVHAEIDKLARQAADQLRSGQPVQALISGTTEHADYADCDFVLEAVFEEMSVKKEVFASLEKHVSDNCVLATNTSSLSVIGDGCRSRASRAGDRLPLLQPGRGAAPARGDQGQRPPTTRRPPPP